MKPHKVVVALDAAGRGSVSVDGIALQVKSFQIRGIIGELTEVFLELENCMLLMNVGGEPCIVDEETPKQTTRGGGFH